MDMLSAVTLASKGLGMARSLFARAQQSPRNQFELQSTPGETLVQRRDTDGDGQLSLSELGMQESVFNRIDRDGDGLLTVTELNEAAARHAESVSMERGIARYMELHDADFDDRISLLESGLDDGAFREFDLSEDGYLARNEVARGIRSGLDVRS